MGRIIEELKHRSAFKVAAAYLVVGWALVEVADTIAPMMGLPDTAPRFVLFLLVVLFPIALFLAWAFDMQPADAEASARTSAMNAFAPVAVSVLALGALSFGMLRNGGRVAAEPAESVASATVTADNTPARTSLAVLPFIDLSPDGDQEYFGDGMAEALLNVLASLDDLSLASRTSAFAFKESDRNVGEIANILRVAYVLEGSVQKSGNRVRITAQLIDAGTDRHLWSGSYDRDLTDIFDIQDEIVDAIVSALRTELGLSLPRDLEVIAVTDNLDAYDLYLQARAETAILSTESVRRSVDLAQRAVELDSDFSQAWSFLANQLFSLPTWDHLLDPIPYNQRAIIAAERSLQIDSSSPLAHQALASAHFNLNEWENYAAAVRRAQSEIAGFEVEPYALMGLGYLSQANELAREMANRSADDGFLVLQQALYLEAMGQSDLAIEQFELAILKGYHGGAQDNMASAYWDAGETSMWTAIVARRMVVQDPELLPLLPHMRDLLLAEPSQREQAVMRFRSVAQEFGFEVADLVRPASADWGFRVPEQVIVALGRSDILADDYWRNSPKMWMWSRSFHEFRQSEAFRNQVRASGMLAYWQSYGWPDLCRPVSTDDFVCD